MRATPASRSTRAVGSGDWWNEVSTTASANRQSARRPTSRSRSPARTGGGSASTQGLAQISTSVTPGSSRAAAAPSGPHSIVTSDPAATARTAGPARSTSPAPSRRTTRTRLTRTPSVAHLVQQVVHRFGQRAPHDRSRADLRGSGYRGRDEHAGRPGRLRGLDVAADVADVGDAVRLDARAPRAASSSMPGRGLRHGQPSSGACGQIRQTSNGPSRRSTRRSRPPPRRGEHAPPDAGLVRHDARADARGAQPRRAAAGGGHRSARGTGRRSRARRRPGCRPGRRARPRAGGLRSYSE